VNRFLMLPETLRMTLLLLSALAVAMQTIGVMTNFFRFKKTRIDWLEIGAEAVLLFHHLLLSLVLTAVGTNQVQGIIGATSNVSERYVVFVLFTVLVLLQSLLLRERRAAQVTVVSVAGVPAVLVKPLRALLRRVMRKGNRLVLLPIAALTLPAVEPLLGAWFPPVYSLAVLFWLLRSVGVVLRRRYEMAGELSGFSIKEAMDALHSGLLYYEASGKIRLMNRQMQRLMLALTGEVLRNGTDFRRILQSSPARTVTLEGYPVYQMTDGTVWLFGEDESRLFGQSYTRIYAAEVTEQWNLTSALEEREELLTARQEELRAALTNLEEIRHAEERLRVKSKVHDIMAQRLAMLMQLLRVGKLPERLGDYVGDLLGDVRAEAEEEQDSLETLQHQFAAIGVTVELEGQLPERGRHNALCIDLAREGITNAVRHSLASRVLIRWTESEQSFIMSVSNSGFSSKRVIREGGGITELRRKLGKVGGSLFVKTRPAFVLEAIIPKGASQ
jgi:Signal transduction histidine kinase